MKRGEKWSWRISLRPTFHLRDSISNCLTSFQKALNNSEVESYLIALNIENLLCNLHAQDSVKSEGSLCGDILIKWLPEKMISMKIQSRTNAYHPFFFFPMFSMPSWKPYHLKNSPYLMIDGRPDPFRCFQSNSQRFLARFRLLTQHWLLMRCFCQISDQQPIVHFNKSKLTWILCFANSLKRYC